jgi:heme-degrading monooxygenase HmoA
MSPIIDTPEPPFYAVIFTATHTDDTEGYAEKAERMYELASAMPGFIGIEAASMESGGEISVTYWRDEESIREWKADADHLVAQQLGKERWFDSYAIRVAKVERAYDFSREPLT